MRALRHAVASGSAKLGVQSYTLPAVPEHGQHHLRPALRAHGPGALPDEPGRLPPGEDALAAFMYQSRVNESLSTAGVGGGRPGMTRHMR